MVDLNQTLEDDNSAPYGGISVENETLEHFLQEVGMPLDAPIEEINKSLRECGIKEINVMKGE